MGQLDIKIKQYSRFVLKTKTMLTILILDTIFTLNTTCKYHVKCKELKNNSDPDPDS